MIVTAYVAFSHVQAAAGSGKKTDNAIRSG